MRRATTANSGTAPAPDSRAVRAILAGRHGDPFSVLGPHPTLSGGLSIGVFAPDAEVVEVLDAVTGNAAGQLERVHPGGFFLRHCPLTSRRATGCASGRAATAGPPPILMRLVRL